MWLLGAWVLVAMSASVVALTLFLQSGTNAFHDLAALTSADAMQAGCRQLEQRIDSLVESSRVEKALSPVAIKVGNYSIPEMATSCGLSLVEYSLATPSERREKTTSNTWRMICVGSARSWGRFLSTLEHTKSGMTIQSGTWSCKGVADHEVRGDVSFAATP
jgi:hypothetical protein